MTSKCSPGIRFTVVFATCLLAQVGVRGQEFIPSPGFETISKIVNDESPRLWKSPKAIRGEFLSAYAELTVAIPESRILKHLTRAGKGNLRGVKAFEEMTGLQRVTVAFHERFELEELRRLRIPLDKYVDIKTGNEAHKRALIAENLFLWLSAMGDPEYCQIKPELFKLDPYRLSNLGQFSAASAKKGYKEWRSFPNVDYDEISLLYRFSREREWASNPSDYRRRLVSLRIMQELALLVTECKNAELQNHIVAATVAIALEVEARRREDSDIAKLPTDQVVPKVLNVVRAMIKETPTQNWRKDNGACEFTLSKYSLSFVSPPSGFIDQSEIRDSLRNLLVDSK